jgi:predicted DsbA family dithiol-disulfide isomerase
MERAKVYLFTSPTCPHCPHAKEFMKRYKKLRDDFVYYDLSTATPAGQRKASEFGIMSVPSFIVQGPATNENLGFVGVPSEKIMNKLIDMSLGNYVEETAPKQSKPGFFKRIRENGLRIGRLRIKF